MSIPQEKNISWYRGQKGSLPVFRYKGTDISGREVSFIVKAQKANDAAQLITRTNTAGGGDDNQLTVVYADSVNKITAKLVYLNTASLSEQPYYYEIVSVDPNDSTDREVLFYGLFTVIASVAFSGDDTTTQITYKHPGFAKFVQIKLTPPNTFSEVSAPFGFDGTLSYSVSGDTVTITSTANDFDEMFRAEGSVALNWNKLSATQFAVTLSPNWDSNSFIVFEVYKR